MPSTPDTKFFSPQESRETRPLSSDDLAILDTRPSAHVGMPVAELLGKVGRTLHDLNAQRGASPLATELPSDQYGELVALVDKARAAFVVIQQRISVEEAPTQEEINTLQALETELEKRLEQAA